MHDDLNSNNENNFNNLARLFESFNFSKFKNSNFLKFKTYKTLKLLNKIKGKQELTNNYYLFYFEKDEENLHVKNIKTSDEFCKELYYSNSPVDSSFHQNSIFVCGGYNEVYLNTCAILDLESRTIDKTKVLNEKKSHVSLISTGLILFCLGGSYHFSFNNCEYFNKEKLQWMKINPLNNSDYGINSSFDSQKYIYTFGGKNMNSYERFDPAILTGKWELINVSDTSKKRFYGNSFLLNDAQFHVFGGEKTQNTNFYLFNVNSQILEKLNKEIKESNFFSSKPIYFEGSIWIVDQYEYEMNILKVNAASLDCEKEDTIF